MVNGFITTVPGDFTINSTPTSVEIESTPLISFRALCQPHRGVELKSFPN